MAMPFAIPVVWREPSNHSSDCYFCLTPPVASDMNRKKSGELTIQIYPLPSDLCLTGKICVSGTAEIRHITMPKGYGLPERFWSQDTKM